MVSSENVGFLVSRRGEERKRREGEKQGTHAWVNERPLLTSEISTVSSGLQFWSQDLGFEVQQRRGLVGRFEPF